MEKAKNDEKIEQDDRPDNYNQGFAFGVIGLMFFLLTLVTSYESFSVLPVPSFFYWGSLIIAMTLVGFSILLVSMWLFRIRLQFIYVAGVLIFCAFILFHDFWVMISVFGSWFFVIFYAIVFLIIPVGVFPLLMIATVCVGIRCAIKSMTIPRTLMKISTYLILLFAMVYIWGHAPRFEGYVYDEGLDVEGTTYHSIIRYGWLGDPGLTYLYECSAGYFGCDLIYDTSDYNVTATRLVYDEFTAVLRRGYPMSENAAQYGEIPPILYEHPVR